MLNVVPFLRDRTHVNFASTPIFERELPKVLLYSIRRQQKVCLTPMGPYTFSGNEIVQFFHNIKSFRPERRVLLTLM